MTEEENTYKISVPLISDNEIKQIDSYLDDIVHQFTRQLVHDKDLAVAQHIIQKQQEEIEKLRNKNQDLLRKLRNRVKEVKKLTKYSLYKGEFSRLNKHIQKKDKIIDEMANAISNIMTGVTAIREQLATQYCDFIKSNDDCCWKVDKTCKDCIKQYFESKVF